jgi:hypothetical protein
MSAPQSLLSPDPPAQDGFPRTGLDYGVRSDTETAADDLPALRLIRVPDWGAPFDGDPAADDSAACAGQFGSGWDQAGPGAGQDPRDATAARAAPAAGTEARTGGQPTARADASQASLEASAQWAQQFARLLAEALAGARPVRQILPWTSERARGHLGRLAPLFGGGQRPRVLRIITTRPTREVIEMTVIVGVGTRTRALAVRLEQAALHRLARPAEYATRAGTSLASAHRWVCTDIEAA